MPQLRIGIVLLFLACCMSASCRSREPAPYVVRMYSGQHFSIRCGEYFYNAEKYVLKFNGIAIRKKTSPFVYDFGLLEFIDNGSYSCVASMKKASHNETTILIVMALPQFKDPSMSKNILWKENSRIVYNCELDSKYIFTYTWYSTDQKLLKVGPSLSMSTSEFDPCSIIYCYIYFKEEHIFTQPVKLLIKTVVGPPFLEYILSTPSGFVVKWYPPATMYDMHIGRLTCKSILNKRQLGPIESNYTYFNSFDDLQLDDILLCSLVCSNGYDDSLPLRFKYTVEQVWYNISMHRFLDTSLTFSYEFFFKNIARRTRKEVSHFYQPIDVEVQVDDREPVTLFNVHPQIKFTINISEVKSVIKIVLRDELLDKRIVGMLSIFNYKIYPMSGNWRVFEVADLKMKFAFVPFFSTLFNQCTVKVLFLKKLSAKDYRVDRGHKYTAYRDGEGPYYVVKLSYLSPQTLYYIKFQYRFPNSKTFSDYSPIFNFRTGKLRLPNPYLSATTSAHYVKFTYSMPDHFNQFVTGCTIRVTGPNFKLRINCKDVNRVTLRKSELPIENISATIQLFSELAHTKVLKFDINKKHPLDWSNVSHVFGLLGLIVFLLYTILWFTTKAFTKFKTPFQVTIGMKASPTSGRRALDLNPPGSI